MRISDWSSDVCSSDLFCDYQGVGFQRPIALAGGVLIVLPRIEESLDDLLDARDEIVLGRGRDIDSSFCGQEPRGRWRHRSHVDRKSVVEGKSVAVRVDLVGGRILKKKKKKKQI